ncbi:glycoside hydrolase family 72 protein [Zopfia rhizophila CBS 207.26]|uniref:1,3-beta-glucanosyltransferase n=1 Tax=Zopfia rhizophila CBS 207.26 TaxID=1314779 RepID=A0A6A6E333_9PEZI|nr:glycoside hydrolase family 72 protein [Zopfia rhizophila CBS 207.26]
MRFAALLSCALGGIAAVNAIPTISVKGSKFFTSEGSQFFTKGIAYQLVPDDPLIDEKQCKLDAAFMKELGANSIRVYHVDHKADHTACMKVFADAGIYLWLDLDTFDTQIVQDAPKWTESQLKAFQAVMDEFQQFDNTAGFFVGNEVLNMPNGAPAAPFVKAAARDLKAYRDSKKYRKIPVGYSAADIAGLRPMLQDYLACGENAAEALDFFSLNAYEWCGKSTYIESGYAQLNQNVSSYNIPIYFSETGCNVVKPRLFDDQAAIFGDEMVSYWSGSIVYEWIEEANSYGLIKYGEKVDPAAPSAPPDGFTRSGKPTPINPDFENLSKHWKTLNPTGVKEKDYYPNLTPPPCPAHTSGAWEVHPDAELPTLGRVLEVSSRTKGTSADSASKSASDHASSHASGHVSASANAAGESAASESAAPTKGGAPSSPVRELKGMFLGLMGVLVSFFWWM